jgi:hypothetical protein
MAVTVVCDEKSMVDRAHERGHSLLRSTARPNDVGCSSAPSRKAREGARPAFTPYCRNSETTSIAPTMFSFNFSRSAAGIQCSRCSELPTVCTS